MPGSRLALALFAFGISVTLSAQPVPQTSRTTPHAGTHLSSNSVLTWDSGTFQYDGSGNIKAIGTNIYVYDTAGRLVSGTAAGPANREVYAYDAAGNRLSAALTPGSTPCTPNVACSEAISVDPATNHLTGTGIQYDDAGNLVAKDGTVYVYDAAKMLTRRDDASAVYVYTADDERLATIVGGGSWKWTVRNLDGKVLREFTGSNAASAQWSRDYVYRGSQLLATQTSSGVSRFHLDQLGTPRLITDANNTRVGQHDYYPFGTELSSSLNEPSAISMKFTGHERDVSVNGFNLDYMHARYYSGGQGRFMSSDKERRSAHPGRPTTWNRYAYARNAPMDRYDPDGRTDRRTDTDRQITDSVPVMKAAAIMTAESAKKKVEYGALIGKIKEGFIVRVFTSNDPGAVNPGAHVDASPGGRATIKNTSAEAIAVMHTHLAEGQYQVPGKGTLFEPVSPAQPSANDLQLARNTVPDYILVPSASAMLRVDEAGTWDVILSGAEYEEWMNCAERTNDSPPAQTEPSH
jgi:RHS repeat-associated protein